MDEIRIEATFGRKKQVAPYEMAEASLTISQVFRSDVSVEEVERVARAQFITLKSEVLQQLGLEFEQDEDTMIIQEVFRGAEVVELRRAPAPAEAVAMHPASQAAAPAPVAAAVPTGTDGIVPANEKEELFLDIMRNPADWSRVTSDNPKAPNFRHKTKTQPNSTYKISLWERDAPRWFRAPI